ncbi:general secretion pathway protein G [Beggiatoa alba B18LD]|uniref:Type II secretion system core protein G n=1 Tax=Beggiatoa alba B18LD TaxID=395493 RepID=I3CCV4_9GAMM|nr:type II secretion system major pseudopilin GspG [Beggiatoa alba]EIJ41447.1 general secretion pathway protein G [Beggiatoa alba B18LD]
MIKQQGFTLIEILIVMAIIGLLAGLVGPKIFGGFEQAKCNQAKAQLKNIEVALDQHRLDTGKYPRGLDGLLTNTVSSNRWSGPYLKQQAVPTDPWEHQYQYKTPGTKGGDYDLYSLGGDGVEGGQGCPNEDITNWKSAS